ncbi:hypothetical protein DFH09DRAFT_947211 [Mycena vulgaris]|nr:hypothetical protein DFH09DRAFT_947211 [Mycena vulgaris]
MAPITNARVLFAAIPKGAHHFPIPGETTVYDTSKEIDLEAAPLNGGFLIRTLVLSIDPYMINGYGVGVLRSENPKVVAGKHVYGIIHCPTDFFTLTHQQYTVLPSMEGLTFLEKDPKLPWTVFVGAAGMPGKTAFMGWKEFSHAKKGETAFISTGAGGRLADSMVIQLAKCDGLKVIAFAGSDAKVMLEMVTWRIM